MHGKHNSIANALELRLSWSDLSIYSPMKLFWFLPLFPTEPLVPHNLFSIETSKIYCKWVAPINEMLSRLYFLGSTHRGRVAIIGSDNGLSPGRRNAIIWTNAGTLSSEFRIQFRRSYRNSYIFKMHLNMSFAKWRSFCLGPSMLIRHICVISIHNHYCFHHKC